METAPWFLDVWGNAETVHVIEQENFFYANIGSTYGLFRID